MKKKFFNKKNKLKKKLIKKKIKWFLKVKKVIKNLKKVNYYSYNIFLLKKNIYIKQTSLYFFFLGKKYLYNNFKKIKYLENLIFGISIKRFFNFFIVFNGLNRNYLFNQKLFLILQQMQDFVLKSKVNLILIRIIKFNKKRKLKLKTYQGYRYKNHLPIRGQRTYRNAGTSKRLNKYD